MLPSDYIKDNALAILSSNCLSLIDKLHQDSRLGYIEDCAYILATVKHETANTYKPIVEYGKGKGHPYAPIYYGRGYIQLTWETNYELFSKLLNIDLIDDPKDPNDNSDPDKATDPEIAYEIMVLGMTRGLFTGKKLSDYINDDDVDYVNARRIINGIDKAVLISGYAQDFENLLKKVYPNV